jgi:hypothetical protein
MSLEVVVVVLTARYLESSSIFMVKGRDMGGRPVGVWGVE